MATRWAVWERDNYTCLTCGARSPLSIDHVIPECLGGETTMANLQTLCWPCNQKKSRTINGPKLKPQEAMVASLAAPETGPVVSFRDLRQQRLLSIRDLAKAAGVSPQTIVTIESGKRPPRPSTMRKLSTALGVDAKEIDEFRGAIAQWISAEDTEA